MSDPRTDAAAGESNPGPDPELDDLLDELETLERTVDDPEEVEQVRETIRVARRVSTPSAFGRVIRGFDRHDAAESLVGSIVVGVPMLVEGGTLEIGAHLATHPVAFLATLVGTVGVVVGVLYVAEIQQVEIYRPFFGVVPRRLVGVLAISFATALALMTGWGRVEWTDPWLAVCQTTVTFAPMALGGALGDILPGS
ncbi:DUF2391 domain-containing protein [Halorussus caseinilyticus]|uniref:DUF2391 domain-containing protein n=1 Tax=Halorussus caseinilyticus TaxID=3034025 RepID=A0ABD5WHT9_9EURY|nr:DUF2391 domain-containing protein [Halorussus sp. DT72]